ncbi:hypothetical protein C9J21_13590 [Photobacterium phosphoreum]|uniref:hypothetical protein n=1 Tax=Photobacterium phosphoreum TaxID=659 RepID=UPI000D17BA53|nr:hypothetical protein [Photobacterium phosphoreum]PSW32153.1 hypothetical protein C9J21_13590 [Photobacterium phosphoreum]
MYKFLLSILFLTIGFSCGVWIGAFYEVKPALGVIAISDLVSLTFTILGGSGGFIAAIIALYAWSKWKVQHQQGQYYVTKIEMLKLLNILELQASNMVSMRANPSDQKFESCRAELIDILGKIYIETTLIQNIEKSLPSEERLDISQLQFLQEISSDLLNLKLWPETDTINYLSISSFTSWKYERSKEWFESLPFRPSGVGLRCIDVSIIRDGIKEVLNKSSEQLIRTI